jgi:serine protease Do
MATKSFRTPRGKGLTARRATLLASVAVLGATMMIGGFGYEPSHFIPLTSAAHATEAQRPAGFADLVAKVKPAVISVRVKMEDASNHEGATQNEQFSIPPGSPMEKFFQQFGGNQGSMPGHRRHFVTGEGSGFFISADGYAVTNFHVVDHAKSVQVKTDDGTEYTAKVVGTDKKTDLALIKVDAKKDFAFVKFGDEQARVGDWVVAVGNPFGLGGTVTAGIVSARGRDIGAGPYDDYIQIDAPINKGNSGGPAFNANGEVIGVNTAIYSPSGGSVGIGFDIPADTAKMVIAQLKENGSVTRGWIGVQVQPVTQDIADSLDMKNRQGAMVDEPQPNSPAAAAGVKAGDVITAINDNPVKDARDLARKVASVAPGTSVKFDLLRDGNAKTLNLTVAKMPDQQQQQATAAPQQGESEKGLYLVSNSPRPARSLALATAAWS